MWMIRRHAIAQQHCQQLLRCSSIIQTVFGVEQTTLEIQSVAHIDSVRHCNWKSTTKYTNIWLNIGKTFALRGKWNKFGKQLSSHRLSGLWIVDWEYTKLNVYSYDTHTTNQFDQLSGWTGFINHRKCGVCAVETSFVTLILTLFAWKKNRRILKITFEYILKTFMFVIRSERLTTTNTYVCNSRLFVE